MEITKERTRIIFTDFSPLEKKKIDDLVGTMDKVFSYEDPDGKMIGLPTGMEEPVRRMFPNVKIKDHSSEYWPYERITPVQHSAEPRNQLQVDFIKFVLDQANKKNKLAGILSPGTGKMEPYSRKIPTPYGWKYMGDLQIGDKIFGSNGQIRYVTDIFEHGEQDIYKITFSDGRTAYCGKDHLWNVFGDKENTYQVTVSTEQMLEDFKVYDEKRSRIRKDPHIYQYRIPLLTSPVKYQHRRVPVDPYIVGAFIGNGLGKDKFLCMSCKDDYIPSVVSKKCGFTWKKYKHNRYDFQVNGHGIRTEEFFKGLPELLCYSGEKKIPDVYLYNDMNTRMELLRGLMDSNGSISEHDNRFEVTYSSTSEMLLNQIRQLILGLGYISNISVDKRKDKYTSKFCGNVSIRVPHKFKQKIFTHPDKYQIARRAGFYRKDIIQPFKYLTIKNIEFSHRECARCITTSAPDHLYVTEDFIVTHNTFMACYSAIKVGLRTLIIVPTSGIKVQWGETLINMFHVDPSRVKLVNSPKDFINVKADFVVATQASLGILNNTYDLEKIMKVNKFGIKVIDEVQMWFHNIIKVDANSNICHNWYLTGTFGRSGDEENSLYQQMFGDLKIFREEQKKPTLFNRKPGNVYGMKPHMHVKMMWTKSGLSREEIKAVTSSMRYSERAGKWMRYGISIPAYTELVIPSDGTMTKFLQNVLKVVKMAENEVKYGKMLILSPTINSVNIIASYVEKMFPDKKIGTINSHNSKAENDRVKAECDILISTVKSCGTGFDVKGLSKLVVAEQFKSWILADQVSGRLRRRDDGKDTYMWDIVDSQIPQLRAWANARADVLKKKAKSFKVIDL
ncbi:MAG: hypothetical protein NC489_11580 [Ruminococcus flavefaciens]|nr:hypothetical protein [Ruminococcus flavefaciens]